MPIDPEAFLFLLISQWAVATLALLGLGFVRWRRGTPGGGRAALAAACGLTLPLIAAVLAALDEFGVARIDDIIGDDENLGPLLLAAAAAPMALSAWAATGALRGAEDARRDLPRGGTDV